MRDLVPIKVKIGLKSTQGYKAKEFGHALYPNFNRIDSKIRQGMDWSKYIDLYGTGWHYDSNGHKEDDWESPLGMQWGLLFIPKDFAAAAVKLFPEDVTVLSEIEAEGFYDYRHATQLQDNLVDDDALKELKLKVELGGTLTISEEIRKSKALDPDDPTPGIVKNPRKTFKDFKKLTNINIVK